MKKTIAAVMSVLAALWVCISQVAYADAEKPPRSELLSNAEIIYGDTNSDGETTLADAVCLLKYCGGLVNLGARQLVSSDVNVDGYVNTADAMVLLKYNAELIDMLPYTEYIPSDDSFSFINYSFPQNGERVSYLKSYKLSGVVLSDYAMKIVRVRIINMSTGEAEIDKTIYLNPRDDIRYYNTATSPYAIDNHIRFASLSCGEKKIQLYTSNEVHENVLLYEDTFRVGYTFSEVAGHVYNINDKVSSSEARKVLSLLNSLDYTNDTGAHIVDTGIKNLGQLYKTMDCSKFVKLTMKDAIDFDLPRISADQALFCTENGYAINESDMRAGDVVFMSRTYCDCGRYHEVHHSAIYIGEYDGTRYIIESTSGLNGVVIRRIWGLVSGRWIIDSVARLR